MPPQYVVSDNHLVQANLLQRLNGQRVLNTLHYRVDVQSPGVNVDGVSLLDALNAKLTDLAGLVPFMRAAQGAALVLENIRLQVVQPIRRPYQQYDYFVAGLHAGTTAPSGIDAVIVKQSSMTGRGRSGTFHLGGVPQTEITNGMFSDPYFDLLDDVAEEIRQIQTVTVAGNTVDLIPAMWNGLTIDENDDIWAAYAKPEVRYITRRTVGRGE